ncbi:MAG: hypothetical protein V1778_03065 [bacterium]
MTRRLNRFRIIAMVLLFSLPLPSFAAFSPDLLLADSDLEDGGAMSRSGIVSFLSSHGSALATRRFETPDGSKSAALIIYEAGKRWTISQKYLLVRLQVEQSLITDPNPSQQQLDWATGYSCRDGGTCDSRYKGFFLQVEMAAQVIRSEKYLGGIEKNGHTISGWGPNITKTTLDGISVTPQNAATAVLYTYTPWVGKYGGGDSRYGGSSLVWKKFNDWFFRKFPEGALVVEAGSAKYYRIEDGKKRRYRSQVVLNTNTDPKKAIPASSAELAAYEDGDPIVFANYSLIRSPRGTVFLIVDGTKRGIASHEVFRTLGFNPEEMQRAAWSDINVYPDGPIIDLTSAYPAGALLRSAENGGIVYVENGIRHAIFSKEILVSRFKGRPRITVHQAEIDQYTAGDPVLFSDGELVRTDGDASIYFISQGQRCPIASGGVFKQLGFKWSNVITTNSKSLEIHSAGAPITLEADVQ